MCTTTVATTVTPAAQCWSPYSSKGVSTDRWDELWRTHKQTLKEVLRLRSQLFSGFSLLHMCRKKCRKTRGSNYWDSYCLLKFVVSHLRSCLFVFQFSWSPFYLHFYWKYLNVLLWFLVTLVRKTTRAIQKKGAMENYDFILRILNLSQNFKIKVKMITLQS